MGVLRLFCGFPFPFLVPFPNYSHFLAAVCSKASTLMFLIYCLLLLPLFVFFLFHLFIYSLGMGSFHVWFLYCCAILNVISSFTII